MAGFEPTAFRSQSGRATKLRHTPSGATRRVHARRQRGCRISRASVRTTLRAPPGRRLERPGRAVTKRPPSLRHGAHPNAPRVEANGHAQRTPGARAVSRRAAGPTSGRPLASGTDPAQDTRSIDANGHARRRRASRGIRGEVVVTPRRRRVAGRPAHGSGDRLRTMREAPTGRDGWRPFRAGGRRQDGDRLCAARGEDAQGVRRSRFLGAGVRARRSRRRRRVTSVAAPLRASVRPARDARGRGRTEGVCDEG